MKSCLMPTRLSTPAARSAAIVLEEHLSPADWKWLQRVFDQSEDGRTRVSVCVPAGGQLSAFTSFSSRFNRADEEQKIQQKLVADSRKRSAPDQRFCWFEGFDSLSARVDRALEP